MGSLKAKGRGSTAGQSLEGREGSHSAQGGRENWSPQRRGHRAGTRRRRSGRLASDEERKGLTSRGPEARKGTGLPER